MTKNHPKTQFANKNRQSFQVFGLIFAISLLFSLVLPLSTYAISEEQSGAISQHCGTIKQSLAQLQRADSRTRTYLGTTYETIINKFITPLNLRLVKNNFSPFTTLQSNFISEQNKFKEAYTDYMREMEALVGIDCQVEPEAFYYQLITVRDKRSILHTTAEKLSDLADEQYAAVKLLKDTL